MNGERVQNEFQAMGQREEVPSLHYNRDASLKEWKSWRSPILFLILNAKKAVVQSSQELCQFNHKMHEIAKNV